MSTVDGWKFVWNPIRFVDPLDPQYRPDNLSAETELLTVDVEVVGDKVEENLVDGAMVILGRVVVVFTIPFDVDGKADDVVGLPVVLAVPEVETVFTPVLVCIGDVVGISTVV